MRCKHTYALTRTHICKHTHTQALKHWHISNQMHPNTCTHSHAHSHALTHSHAHSLELKIMSKKNTSIDQIIMSNFNLKIIKQKVNIQLKTVYSDLVQTVTPSVIQTRKPTFSLIHAVTPNVQL